LFYEEEGPHLEFFFLPKPKMLMRNYTSNIQGWTEHHHYHLEFGGFETVSGRFGTEFGGIPKKIINAVDLSKLRRDCEIWLTLNVKHAILMISFYFLNKLFIHLLN